MMDQVADPPPPPPPPSLPLDFNFLVLNLACLFVCLDGTRTEACTKRSQLH